MSKFITPEGREYPITLGEVTNREAKLLQETTGISYAVLAADLERMGPDGKTAFLWLAMRKNDHHVAYDELEFPMGRMQFVMDEPDPTKGSPATPTPARSSSTRSPKSTKSSGSRSTRS